VSGQQKFASDYIDVAARIVEFRTKYPDGSLQPFDPSQPYKIETFGDAVFIVYTAAAYRTPEDVRPGIGIAWEPFPGRTPYTRNSELQNAETSAWGRAIVAALAADTKKGIASAEEVRNRQAEGDPWAGAAPAAAGRPAVDSSTPSWEGADSFRTRVEQCSDPDAVQAMKREVIAMLKAKQIQPPQATQLSKLCNDRISVLEAA
jgi:hypothetical protein